MRIDGRWAADPDGEVRPIIDGTLVTPTGAHVPVELLLDTGANSVVLAPHVFALLAGAAPVAPGTATASGVGGTVPLTMLDIDLVLLTAAGQRVRIHGPLPIALDAHTLDRSVLGRNFTNQFTVVCSRPQNTVFLISPPDSAHVQ